MSKKKQQRAEAGTQADRETISTVELEDILNDMQETLGSLGIIAHTMANADMNDSYSGIEESTTRHILYRLGSLADESLEKLEKAHDALYEIIYPKKLAVVQQ